MEANHMINASRGELSSGARGERSIYPQVASPKNHELIYQVVKLNKVMQDRFDINKILYRGIESVHGLSYLAPDTQFYENSVLSHLITSPCSFLIVISMYNEDSTLLKSTIDGVFKNLKTFVENGVPASSIGCIIIVDGMSAFLKTYREELNANIKDFNQYCNMEEIANKFTEYEDDLTKCQIPNEAGEIEEEVEFAHLFMQKMKNPNDDLELNLIFCIKQKNRRKLNSHLWFFGGFCELIKPTYVMLLDVGTKPLDNALYYLYEAMENEKNVAGCCGEIKPISKKAVALVVPAQVVEYKFAHTFDKSLESLFGYVSVLPGAFSAYRYQALQGTPLRHYFKSLRRPEKMTAFKSNIYLAEDRVLCLFLVAKKADGEPSYILRYVRKAVAETDVPSSIGSLMVQRRRWINGSWFALIDSLKKCRSIYSSNHSWCRKFFFAVEFVYFFINVLFSWFMVGSFFLVFAVTVHGTFQQDNDDLFTIGNAIIIIYNAMLFIVLLISLGVEPRFVKRQIECLSWIFGAYMLGTFILMVIFLIDVKFSAPVIAVLAFCTVGMFIVNIVANNALCPIIKGILQFLFLTPTYVNIFNIYAICNLHDCTWGNRPDILKREEKDKLDSYKLFRTGWLIAWLLSNAGFAYFINFLNKSKSYGAVYIYVVAVIGIILLGFRFICGCLYLIQEACKRKRSINEEEVEVGNRDESVNEGEQLNLSPAARELEDSAAKIEISYNKESEKTNHNVAVDSYHN